MVLITKWSLKLKKNKVLIVEDELLAATFLKRILVDLGYEVVASAVSADEAILYNKDKEPDIILMDIALEGLKDGCEAAFEIKKTHPNVRLFFLSAHTDDDTISRVQMSKPCGFILKPYNVQQIKISLMLDQVFNEEDKDNTLVLEDNYFFNLDTNRLCLKEGIEVDIGVKGLKVMAMLAKNPNTSVSNKQIMMEIYKKEVPIQTLRSLMHRIRVRSSANIIKNINGVGYMLGKN